MAFNYVTITGTIFIGSGAAVSQGAGGVTFTSSDIIWDASGLFVAVLEPVNAPINVNGTFATGPAAPQLFAMDNAGISGNWSWICTVEIGGQTWPARKITVNYSIGPTQDFSTLLGTSVLA
jgi:hypothetical protein